MRKIKIVGLVLVATFAISACNKGNTGSQAKTSEAPTVTLSAEEVAKHATPEDCWLIIANKVYRVTDFLNEHPGGSFRITPFCGKDATKDFETQGGRGQHSADAMKILSSLLIGGVGENVKISNSK